MKNLFGNIYKNKKVLVTGHTGFKGSWLIFWLQAMGAEVCGYSLGIPTQPSHFEVFNLSVGSIVGDVRDHKAFSEVLRDFKPEIIFHLAAQPIVRLSYKHPIETLDINIMGSANILEAVRSTSSVKALVMITSDKCYRNKGLSRGYVESDELGGYDPYSASKACAELVIRSFQNSFFNLDKYDIEHNVLIASARAGNVIGGGDWAQDRLVPDIVKAANKRTGVIIRNPNSTRPWQHVLEPLSGYLMLGWKLLEKDKDFASSWNFGPPIDDCVTVGRLVEEMKKCWKNIDYKIKTDPGGPHEDNLLMLDSSLSRDNLKWSNVWDYTETIKRTIGWYKRYYENSFVNTENDLKDYINEASKKGLVWT